MTTEDRVRAAGEYGDAKNRHDVAAAMAACTDDFFLEVVPFGSKVCGKAEATAFFEEFFRSFPDYRHEIEMRAAADEGLVALWDWHGTMRGPFLGQAPTGRAITVPAVSAYFFRDGRLAGERVYFDLATLCEQAGISIASIKGSSAAALPFRAGRRDSFARTLVRGNPERVDVPEARVRRRRAAMCESFFATLGCELLDRTRFTSGPSLAVDAAARYNRLRGPLSPGDE